METDKLYELRVLTGLHRGAALPLNGEQWSIGSSAGADLALYDPGIRTGTARCDWSMKRGRWPAVKGR